MRPGRNDPCICGSGRKFKRCCALSAAPSGIAGAATAMSNEHQVDDPAALLREFAALARAARHADMEVRARALIDSRPQSGVAWKALSYALQMQGKDALQALQTASALLPEDPEILSNLGIAQRGLGRIDDAIVSLRRAVERQPLSVEIHNNLGNALREGGEIGAAVDAYRRAIGLAADHAQTHVNLGMALRLEGRVADAQASCLRALELEPGLAAAWMLRSELQSDLGDFTGAESSLRRAIEIEPDSADAWAGIAGLRRLDGGDAGWLARVQALAERPRNRGEESRLRFAIAKYFDDAGRFDEAFGEYRRANDLAATLQPAYDAGRMTRAVDQILETFDGRWIDSNRVSSRQSALPVFIVGMPRSGTTLAEQILAAHPGVFGAGELPFWRAAVARAARRPGGCIEASDLIGWGEQYLELLRDLAPDAVRVVDKMPGNFLYLGVICAALPQARIINLRRDPRDTCLSIYRHNFGALHPYANDLRDLAHYHGEYSRLMDHWRRWLPSERFLEVSYESLVAEPPRVSRSMVEFIGLPWDDACLDLHANPRSVSTFSKWQVRQPISRTAVGRWRDYARHLGPLAALDPAQ